jgi:hypothetical protein
MVDVRLEQGRIVVETSALAAEIHTTGYVSGVAGGTLLDKATGARDLGFGLDIVDFLLEPKADEPGGTEHPYLMDPMLHGTMIKRYVELPQICTGAQKVEAEVVRGDGFVGVRQSFRYTEATCGRKPGSLWEQVIVFPEGERYFLSSDTITSANTVDDLFLRIDMPGHLKHEHGDSFEQIYLSYVGQIPASEFFDDFGPHERFLYRRGKMKMPERFIRAYQTKVDGDPGPWLAGMTLDPASVSEAWCHQRGYVCFIEEIGQGRVEAGESFGAAYVVGFFDGVEEMAKVYDRYRGAGKVEVERGGYQLK